MLKKFVRDCARVFAKTEHDVALEIAAMLSELEIPDNWQTTPQSDVFELLPKTLDDTDCLPVAHQIAAIGNDLNWCEAPREMPSSFVGKYCFATIVGPHGIIKDDRFCFGAYLQAPETFYPSHRHEAVELYLPLSGTANWQRGEEEFKPVEPGSLIHHPSYLSHATQTFNAPLLALWSWTGTLSFDTYTIDSG